jgi:carbonic anhydrase/acetyltransferase-like protein (isoleucine patch superfamily)
LCCTALGGRAEVGPPGARNKLIGPDSVSNRASPATQTMFCLIYLSPEQWKAWAELVVRGGWEGAVEPRNLVGSLDARTPAIDPDAWIAPGAVVIGRVTIGPATSVWYGSVLRADDDEIVVGAQCNIQDLCCLHVDAGEPAVLEDRVSLGHRATVHGAYVETGALIGIGAIVLGGARVGAGALVAAGAVVLPGTTVPSGVLAAGVPSRIVRELTDADRDGFARTPESYAERALLHRTATWVAPAGGR